MSDDLQTRAIDYMRKERFSADGITARDAAMIISLSARLDMLEGIVRGLLKLHEAHHNHPEHAFARAALRGEQIEDKP